MSTVRDLVFSALTSDVALATLGIDADSCWAAGSFDGPADGPFLLIRWGNTNRGFGAVNSATVTVYVHDLGADYSRINTLLVRLRTVMTGLSATGDATNWIYDVSWLGDGSETSDPTYGTIMRTADFRVIANTL